MITIKDWHISFWCVQEKLALGHTEKNRFSILTFRIHIQLFQIRISYASSYINTRPPFPFRKYRKDLNVAFMTSFQLYARGTTDPFSGATWKIFHVLVIRLAKMGSDFGIHRVGKEGNIYRQPYINIYKWAHGSGSLLLPFCFNILVLSLLPPSFSFFLPSFPSFLSISFYMNTLMLYLRHGIDQFCLLTNL